LRTESESSAALPYCAQDPHRLQSVPILVLHAHSSCNCRCVMCDIWKNRDNRVFGLRDLERQLDAIRRLRVHWVVFSGGEPLMNAELTEMCAVLRTQGIRLTLLTTGILLKKQAVTVSDCFDEIVVSLDGPREIHDAIRRVDRAYQLLAEGIHAVRSNCSTMRITARTTVQKANHAHLCATVRAADSLGLNQISFLAADLTSTAFNRELVWPESRQSEIALSLGEIAVLENEIESLIQRIGPEFAPGFLAESPEKLRRIGRHFRAHLGLEGPESPKCNAPWVSAVIETDGTVRPCFFHRSIGNLRDTELDDVLNSPEARSFRKNLDIPTNSTCRNCVCSLNYRA
jgi:MoaA/NifB/PqqE/SkfB family radical SAM enzyme